MGKDERPGPRGVTDTIGALRGLTSDPCPTLDDLVSRHGPTFVVRGGPLTMVVVGDPDHLGPLFATTVDAFTWGHRFNVLRFIVGVGIDDRLRRRRPPAAARRDAGRIRAA